MQTKESTTKKIKLNENKKTTNKRMKKGVTNLADTTDKDGYSWHPSSWTPTYLADIGALRLGGPGDDAGDGEARLAGVDKVGRVHLPSQGLDVAQDGHLHLQVGRLRLIHDEAHQDVELLLKREGLPAERNADLYYLIICTLKTQSKAML